jgi:hypothetical protein
MLHFLKFLNCLHKRYFLFTFKKFIKIYSTIKFLQLLTITPAPTSKIKIFFYYLIIYLFYFKF